MAELPVMVLGLRDFSPGQNPPEGIGKGAQLAVTDPKFETENAQALHFLRHHLSPTLKDEYMAERSASGLWTALKQRFERLKYTVKPRAEAEWIRLRFADFKTVGEYNSALHRICMTLWLCDTEITDSQKIEKTLSTFHPDAVQSLRNYRQGNYTRYLELIDVFQVAEAQDEVLKKNFVAQPLGGSSRQEVNALKVRKPQQKKRVRKGKKKGPHPPPPPRLSRTSRAREDKGLRTASVVARWSISPASAAHHRRSLMHIRLGRRVRRTSPWFRRELHRRPWRHP